MFFLMCTRISLDEQTYTQYQESNNCFAIGGIDLPHRAMIHDCNLQSNIWSLLNEFSNAVWGLGI